MPRYARAGTPLHYDHKETRSRMCSGSSLTLPPILVDGGPLLFGGSFFRLLLAQLSGGHVRGCRAEGGRGDGATPTSIASAAGARQRCDWRRRRLATFGRAAPVVSAARSRAAVLVVTASLVAAVLRAGAVLAAAGALMTVAVAATFGANSAAMFVLAADETVTTIELRASARGCHQPTGIAEGRAALIEACEPLRRFAADLLAIAAATTGVVRPAYEAWIAVFRSAAFDAFQPAFDAAHHQVGLAQDDV